ncbi:TPA: ChaN family lipoprotein [Aeromonas hydrophila]|uniref:ChaN family lipoprotein n=1 Tax=Aeromonas hydrophila TaxID=644 RepID=UPI0005CEDD24|nr:ChaN family lipoprotein [Aeromonas hydrophila]AJQ53542.1 iron-regulated protein [Aeromonas hydrophila]HAU4884949.1 ChaN family lipoprotein [Aeromonas hydrophila]
MTRLLPLFTLPLLLAACATTAPVNDAGTLYHYQLKATQGNDLTFEQALARVADADIVLVGELHTHPAVHLLQARMLAGLAADGRPLVLSMEQFSRADQPVLDAYLAGRIGEAALIRDGNAWPNYQSDYRPLVEFAKAHHLPVIAANAPKPLVSCVGQEGPAWLEKLPASRRSQLARTLTLGDDPYRQKFMASLHHGDADSNARRFAAQTSWDDTMAESMVDYLRSHPGQRIMHIAGNFHVEGGLGLASRIASRNPDLKVALVVPELTAPPAGDGQPAAGRVADVRVGIAPLPERWLNADEMKQDMGALHQSRSRDCSQWLQP